MKKEGRNCKICGFFVQNETEENSGYCLIHDDSEIQGENLKIPTGEENSTATTCSLYHRMVPSLSQADFLNWRSPILINQIEKKLAILQNKMTQRMMWLTVLISILTVIQIYAALR